MRNDIAGNPEASVPALETDAEIASSMQEIGGAAKAAASVLATCSSEQKNDALLAAAGALDARAEAVLAANARDMARAREKGIAGAMLDRLELDPSRLAGVADAVRSIAAQDDPVGSVMAEWDRPNGLHIRRVRTPLGVIGVIFESRPNVAADAGALCLKSGNAAILRGGSESFESVTEIHRCLVEGLRAAGLPEASIQRVPTRDRRAVGEMLENMAAHIDVLVPRGGRSLVERVQTTARVPVFAHLDGICHLYLDKSADVEKAVAIAVNAKMRRTGICGAAECLLVDRAAATRLLPAVAIALAEAGCALRGDEEAMALTRDAALAQAMTQAAPGDFGHEFLDAIMAVRIVDGLDGAIEHIRRYGSGHTDAIIAEDDAAWDQFSRELDSAILMRNASTQFADGGEFGMGAEIGIATGKMHARGPVGAEQLTSFKYLVEGDGATRP